MYKYCCDRCKKEVNKCDKCGNYFEFNDIFNFNITSYFENRFLVDIDSKDSKAYEANVESFKFCRECWKNTEKKMGTLKLD